MNNEETITAEIDNRNKGVINYKIMPDKVYTVYKNVYNDLTFYKIRMVQKKYDDTQLSFYKDVRFRQEIDLPNATKIIIKKAFENLYENKKDAQHPVSYLFITDFELVETERENPYKAYSDFRKNLADNKQYDFTFSTINNEPTNTHYNTNNNLSNFDNMTIPNYQDNNSITDEDLPF